MGNDERLIAAGEFSKTIIVRPVVLVLLAWRSSRFEPVSPASSGRAILASSAAPPRAPTSSLCSRKGSCLLALRATSECHAHGPRHLLPGSSLTCQEPTNMCWKCQPRVSLGFIEATDLVACQGAPNSHHPPRHHQNSGSVGPVFPIHECRCNSNRRRHCNAGISANRRRRCCP